MGTVELASEDLHCLEGQVLYLGIRATDRSQIAKSNTWYLATRISRQKGFDVAEEQVGVHLWGVTPQPNT
jgi:hypothetical protein